MYGGRVAAIFISALQHLAPSTQQYNQNYPSQPLPQHLLCLRVTTGA